MMESEARQDHDVMVQFIEEAKRRNEEGFKKRVKLWTACGTRPNEQFFAKLDSSVKRSTAFVRKIKNYTPSQLPSLIADIGAINLTKYVSEIAAALTDAKWKSSDVDGAIEICSALHVHYADFSPCLISNWNRIFSDKPPNGTKLRTDLRLLVECLRSGVLSTDCALPLLHTALGRLQPDDAAHAAALLALAKSHGHALAGLVPATVARAARAAAQSTPRSTLLDESQQRATRDIIKGYFSALCGVVRATHGSLHAHARANKKILAQREQLSAERRAAGAALGERAQRLKALVDNFVELLDEPTPELGDPCLLDADLDDDEGLHVLGLPGHVYGIDDHAWDDEEAMFFYRRLPDVGRFVPAKRSAAELAEEDALGEDVPVSPRDATPASDDADADAEADDAKEDGDGVRVAAGNKSELAEFLCGLHKCVNQRMIDEAALDFLARFNRKSARRRLVLRLARAPSSRLHQLPLLARLVAVVKPAAPDVAADLAYQLKQEFRQHVRKKDQLYLDAKVRTVRFVGELVKFDAFPRVEALSCLQLLLADFTHHNLEMCCHLLETCGRYLLLHARSRDRMLGYLEQVERLRAATALDARYAALVDSALCAARPPTRAQRRARARLPPLHAFVRALLADVGALGVDKVCDTLSLMDWSDADTVDSTAHALAAAHRATHAGAAQLAQLTAQLAARTPELGVLVVDAVLEDVQLGVELATPEWSQRRVAAVRYLGQLYVYRVVDSGVVFDALYMLLFHGPVVEPANSLIKMRLVCTLLDLCAPYFERGESAERLDDFLALFHHYVLAKRALPVWTDAHPFPPLAYAYYKDVTSRLRPATPLAAELTASAATAQRVLAKWHVAVDAEQTEASVAPSYGQVLVGAQRPCVDGVTLEAADVGVQAPAREDADEADFQRRLDELLEASSLRTATLEPARRADVALPLRTARLRTQPHDDDDDEALMNLTLMLRKGAKTQYRRVQLPKDAQLLSKQRQTEQAERAEKERIKRLTLDISRRQLQREEEEEAEREASLPLGVGCAASPSRPSTLYSFIERAARPKKF